MASSSRSKLTVHKKRSKNATPAAEIDQQSTWPSPLFKSDSLKRYDDDFQFKPLILSRRVEFDDLCSLNLEQPLKALGLYELFSLCICFIPILFVKKNDGYIRMCIE